MVTGSVWTRANTLVMMENDEGQLGSLSKFWWQLTIMFLFFCIFHHSFWWSQALRMAAATRTNLRIVGVFFKLSGQFKFHLWYFGSTGQPYLDPCSAYRLLKTSSRTVFSHSQYVHPLSQWGPIMSGACCHATGLSTLTNELVSFEGRTVIIPSLAWGMLWPFESCGFDLQAILYCQSSRSGN